MNKFNIREDLQFRAEDQKLEILAISGSSAPAVMAALVEGRYGDLERRYGVKVSPAAAARIVKRYGSMILAVRL